MKSYYVYMMANNSNSLYIGVTNDLERRVYEHKHDVLPGFTRRYRLHKLVYFEETSDIKVAIEREKTLKGWLRKKKIELIKKKNPNWSDLSKDWYR